MVTWNQIYRVFINPFAEEKEEPALIGGRAMPKTGTERGFGTYLGWVLAIVLAMLWETAFRDANRFLNLYYPPCFLAAAGECVRSAYASTHLFFLFLTTFPIAVFLGIFRYLVGSFDATPAHRVLLSAYTLSVAWMAARFVLELLRYLLAFHHTLGVYTVLGLLAVTLIVLILRVANRPKAPPTSSA